MPLHICKHGEIYNFEKVNKNKILPAIILQHIYIYIHLKTYSRASLMVQWLRICLPMQGTLVQSLVQEGSMCHGATNHGHHATATEPSL